jgi:hypothetical protein
MSFFTLRAIKREPEPQAETHATIADPAVVAELAQLRAELAAQRAQLAAIGGVAAEPALHD